MKILIIKPSSFGDIIHANPTAVALKEAFPESELTWLTFEAWKDVVSLFPDVDKVIVWDRSRGLSEYTRVIGQVRECGFDLVVDLQGLLRSALIARFSGAPRIIGVPGMKELSWLLIKEVFPERRAENAVTRSLACVEHLTGKERSPRFNIKISEEDKRAARMTLERAKVTGPGPVIGLVPFVRGLSKQWPVEYYRTFVDLARERFPSACFIAFGSEADRGILSHPGVADLSGATTARELAALLSFCDVVAGGDTGPMHLAAAMELPSVFIFGGSDVRETSPVSPKAVIVTRNSPCSPCRGRPNCGTFPCLRDIAPTEVLEKTAAILAKGGQR